MGKCVIKTGGAGGTGSDECTATKAQVLKGTTAVTADSDDASSEGTLEVQSVVNFNVAQYSNLTMVGTWALPIKGPWSGIRIMCKRGAYPENIDDGTLFFEGVGVFATKSLAAGTWYFCAWNYMTTNFGRIYGTVIQTVSTNTVIKGNKTFTSSGVFTVPEGIMHIQVYLVGGGGAGAERSMSGGADRSYWSGGGGGGGGKIATITLSVAPGQQFPVIVGAAANTSKFGSYSAAGGSYGNGVNTRQGGAGGSGGGAGSWENGWEKGGNGGTNGASGGWSSDHAGGAGQGMTTRAFGDPTGTLYAGGGGGGAGSNSASSALIGAGGAGGGGTGGNWNNIGSAGSANTGGGGGGGSSAGGFSGFGGTGVVLVRWGF